MNYNNDLLNKVYEMYSNMRFGYNEICLNCKNSAIKKNKELIQGPVPIFHIGENFGKQDKSLLFVGLVAYGWNSIIADHKLIWEKQSNDLIITDKIQKSVEDRFEDLYFNKQGYYKNEKPVKFINFIKAASSEIFGNDRTGYDNIAITNFVKCNTEEVNDNLPQQIRNFCCNINQNAFNLKEIEILKPTHIVVLTRVWKYTRFIHNLDYNIIQLDHPSRPGRVKEEFINEVVNFYNS